MVQNVLHATTAREAGIAITALSCEHVIFVGGYRNTALHPPAVHAHTGHARAWIGPWILLLLKMLQHNCNYSVANGFYHCIVMN